MSGHRTHRSRERSRKPRRSSSADSRKHRSPSPRKRRRVSDTTTSSCCSRAPPAAWATASAASRALSFLNDFPPARMRDQSIHVTTAANSITGGESAPTERGLSDREATLSSEAHRGSKQLDAPHSLIMEASAAASDKSLLQSASTPSVAFAQASNGQVDGDAQLSGSLKNVAQCKCKLEISCDLGADV